MRSFLSLKQRSWTNYYPDLEFTKISKETKTSTVVVENTQNFYITDTLILKVQSDIEGGGIRFISTSNSVRLLIEKTTFIECKSAKKASAIYFYSEGNSVLSNVCGYNCSSDNSTVFYYIQVTKDSTHKNECIQSSFSYGFGKDKGSSRLHNCGFIKNIEINTSSNSGKKFIGLQSCPTFKGIHDFCTFHNNTTIEGIVIVLSDFHKGPNFEQIFMHCNVINNREKQAGVNGIVSFQGFNTVSMSCFAGNAAKYLFSQDTTDTSSVIEKCYSDVKITGWVTVKDPSQEFFIYTVEFLQTALCESEYKKIFKEVYKTCVHNNRMRILSSLSKHVFIM